MILHNAAKKKKSNVAPICCLSRPTSHPQFLQMTIVFLSERNKNTNNAMVPSGTKTVFI